MDRFKNLMNSTEYDFLRTNERLGKRIMLLGLGGSYAYGTNNEQSDIDFRGVTLMMPSDSMKMIRQILSYMGLTNLSIFFLSVTRIHVRYLGWMKISIWSNLSSDRKL